MPEIAGFGKHFYFYKAWDKKVSPQRAMGDPMDEVKRPRQRVASSQQVNLSRVLV